MACKDICKKYKAIDINTRKARYANGQKRCPTCVIFLRRKQNNNCPCCGKKLRLKPKNAHLKRQYEDILKDGKKTSTTLSHFNKVTMKQ